MTDSQLENTVDEDDTSTIRDATTFWFENSSDFITFMDNMDERIKVNAAVLQKVLLNTNIFYLVFAENYNINFYFILSKIVLNSNYFVIKPHLKIYIEKYRKLQ